MNKLEVKNLSHSYVDGMKKKKVLKDINVTFESGKFYAILGESGSGKTTLLSIMAGLLNREEGEILFNGEDIKKKGLNNYRLTKVGIIFQNYNLIPYMTAKENVETLMDIRKNKDKNKIYDYLKQVGIDKETADRNVLKLSGGEGQRVAIARCLSCNIPIILADEPTGNLDEENEENIIKVFNELKKDKIVIVVTHSSRIAKKADIVYELKKGVLIEKK